MAARGPYRRILLKLSGEALGTGPGEGVDLDCIRGIAGEIAAVARKGVAVGVVIGGGNFVRGGDLIHDGMTPAQAHTMGMLATVINGIALQDVLRALGVDARLQSAIPMESVCERYIRERCLKHLDDGRVMILAAGTGSPFFTTDTAAALRAREIGAEVLLKGTNVDAVYSDDPKTNPDAKRYDHLTYDDVLVQNLKVMDATAVALCRDGHMPVIVFNHSEAGNLDRVVAGESVGTYIGGE